MKSVLLTLSIILLGVSVFAQKRQALYAGAGFGVDHGGIGIKMEYQPFRYVGVFGGVGHNTVGFNGNAGLIVNALPKKNFTPVVTGMVGVHSFISVKYMDNNNTPARKVSEQWEGFTIGGGFDLKFGRKKNQKVNAMILVPLYHSGFWHRRSSLIRQGGTIERDVKSVLFAVGWNIDFLNL